MRHPQSLRNPWGNQFWWRTQGENPGKIAQDQPSLESTRVQNQYGISSKDIREASLSEGIVSVVCLLRLWHQRKRWSRSKAPSTWTWPLFLEKWRVFFRLVRAKNGTLEEKERVLNIIWTSRISDMISMNWHYLLFFPKREANNEVERIWGKTDHGEHSWNTKTCSHGRGNARSLITEQLGSSVQPKWMDKGLWQRHPQLQSKGMERWDEKRCLKWWFANQDRKKESQACVGSSSSYPDLTQSHSKFYDGWGKTMTKSPCHAISSRQPPGGAPANRRCVESNFPGIAVDSVKQGLEQAGVWWLRFHKLSFAATFPAFPGWLQGEVRGDAWSVWMCWERV